MLKSVPTFLVTEKLLRVYLFEVLWECFCVAKVARHALRSNFEVYFSLIGAGFYCTRSKCSFGDSTFLLVRPFTPRSSIAEECASMQVINCFLAMLKIRFSRSRCIINAKLL